MTQAICNFVFTTLVYAGLIRPVGVSLEVSREK